MALAGKSKQQVLGSFVTNCDLGQAPQEFHFLCSMKSSPTMCVKYTAERPTTRQPILQETAFPVLSVIILFD